MALLEIDRLVVAYGQVEAVKGISLTVGQGEICALLGANGAGKTTILNAISGLLRARQGRILYGGVDLTRQAAHGIVQLGVAHSPEGRRVFATLTVDENLTLGGFVHRRQPQAVAASKDGVYGLFPRLHERRNQLSGTLSGGEQQMLAIGRALMAEPKLLLLDEPSLGLAPLLVREIFRTIEEVNERGVAILLVEQNARMALRVAHRAYVLETGRITLSGSASELREDKGVQGAYLGRT
jgi:branched-chain amino acid transport system ATP-binding protein